MNSRERFESFGQFTPIELSTVRANPEFGETWGYQYVSLRTQTAWEAWQAAYRAGQEAMRERCLAVIDEHVRLVDAVDAITAIRALPVED